MKFSALNSAACAAPTNTTKAATGPHTYLSRVVDPFVRLSQEFTWVVAAASGMTSTERLIESKHRRKF